MQVHINEWKEIKALTNNKKCMKETMLDIKNLYIFIINKVLQYNVIESHGMSFNEKIEYLYAEKIISIEILQLFIESEYIINNRDYNDFEKLISLKNKIIEWFTDEYKNYELINKFHGNKVFEYYNDKNSTIFDLDFYTEDNKDSKNKKYMKFINKNIIKNSFKNIIKFNLNFISKKEEGKND